MPAMKPSLLLDFANSRQLGPLVTFTRASTATIWNRRGLLETVPSGAPRFDHDPVTLACRGLLIEEARTCLCLYNRDLTNAVWTKSGITATKDQTGIDGAANSATRLAATGSNGTCLQSVTSVSAARATAAYVRRITGSGAVEMTQDGGATWTAVTIVSTRYTRVGPASATVTDPQIGFRLATSGDEIAVDFVTLENGAFSTSPVETTASQVTRANDVAGIIGAEFASFWRQDRGTLVSRHIRFGLATGSQVVGVRGASNSYQYSHGYSISVPDFLRNDVIENGATSASMTALGAAPLNTKIVMASAYATNDFALSCNGGAVVTDTAGVVPALSQMGIGINGALSGGRLLNGWIPSLSYYPERLSNADLQALSAS